MNAPFFKFGLFGDPVALIAAFFLGLGFGWFLERAGFGSARKLTAQFYLRDLAVLKVMFTAILTAMVGLFLLSAGGIVDLSQVTLKPTLLGANVLGGLLLGVGFVIGGYCPGTSVASAATGRIDAWVYLSGMLVAMFGFGEVMGAFPGLHALLDDSESPRLTLAAASGIPYGALVLGVVVMAICAFVMAEWVEVRFGGRSIAEQPLIGAPPATLNPSRMLLLALLLGGVVAAGVGNPYRGPDVVLREADLALLVQREADHLTVEDLADRLIAGTLEYRLVDLRTADEFARGTLPGAENIPLADLPAQRFDPRERLLLFTDGQTHAAQAWVLLKARGMTAIYVLRGGLDGWRQEILQPVVADPPTARDLERIARARAFGGTPMAGGGGKAPQPLSLPDMPAVAAPPPAAAPPAGAPPGGRKKKKEGC